MESLSGPFDSRLISYPAIAYLPWWDSYVTASVSHDHPLHYCPARSGCLWTMKLSSGRSSCPRATTTSKSWWASDPCLPRPSTDSECQWMFCGSRQLIAVSDGQATNFSRGCLAAVKLGATMTNSAYSISWPLKTSYHWYSPVCLVDMLAPRYCISSWATVNPVYPKRWMALSHALR